MIQARARYSRKYCTVGSPRWSRLMSERHTSNSHRATRPESTMVRRAHARANVKGGFRVFPPARCRVRSSSGWPQRRCIGCDIGICGKTSRTAPFPSAVGFALVDRRKRSLSSRLQLGFGWRISVAALLGRCRALMRRATGVCKGDCTGHRRALAWSFPNASGQGKSARVRSRVI